MSKIYMMSFQISLGSHDFRRLMDGARFMFCFSVVRRMLQHCLDVQLQKCDFRSARVEEIMNVLSFLGG